MSESPEQRTKRQYLESHRSEQWQYKHVVFYANPEESVGLLDHMVSFKQLLRRKCPTQPFLIRIQTRQLTQKPLQAYLVLYTSAEVDSLQEIANKTFPCEMNVRGQLLPSWKLEKSARSIEKQRPHNLNKFFESKEAKRWTILNKGQVDVSLRYRADPE